MGLDYVWKNNGNNNTINAAIKKHSSSVEPRKGKGRDYHDGSGPHEHHEPSKGMDICLIYPNPCINGMNVYKDGLL